MKNENQIIIQKEQLLKILEKPECSDKYSDLILKFDEITKKYKIISGRIFHKTDFENFNRYIKKHMVTMLNFSLYVNKMSCSILFQSYTSHLHQFQHQC